MFFSLNRLSVYFLVTYHLYIFILFWPFFSQLGFIILPCKIIQHFVSFLLLLCWDEHFPEEILVGFGCVGDVPVVVELVVFVNVGRVDIIDSGVEVLLDFNGNLGEQGED